MLTSMLWESRVERRVSQCFSRKGSRVSSRASRLVSRGRLGVFVVGVFVREASEGGKEGVFVGGGVGSSWRRVVRMWLLWMVTGSSVKMSV